MDSRFNSASTILVESMGWVKRRVSAALGCSAGLCRTPAPVLTRGPLGGRRREPHRALEAREEGVSRPRRAVRRDEGALRSPAAVDVSARSNLSSLGERNKREIDTKRALRDIRRIHRCRIVTHYVAPAPRDPLRRLGRERTCKHSSGSPRSIRLEPISSRAVDVPDSYHSGWWCLRSASADRDPSSPPRARNSSTWMPRVPIAAMSSG